MGYYIDHTPKRPLGPRDKALALLADVPGAQRLDLPIFGLGPAKWQPNLVCVAHNPTFEAAAYAFDAEEMRRFDDPRDDRIKEWLIVPGAAELSGYARVAHLDNT